jgi:hypothetical protein
MKKFLQLISVITLLFIIVGKTKAQTVYYSEDFEGTTGTAIPATWSQTTLATDGGWLSGTNTTLSSSTFTIPAHTKFLATNDDNCNCDKSNDFLKSASFSLAGATNPVLTLDILYPNGSYQGNQEIGKIEVSTNGGTLWTVIDSLGSLAPWTNYSVDMSAYAGMANVMLGFRYSDGTGYLFGMAIDNIQVIEPPAKAGSTTAVIMNKYALVGNQTIKGVIKSSGGPTVASAILKYSVDGGTPVQQTFSPNIGYNASYTATFSTAATLSLGIHVVKVWIDDINGTGPDTDATNDTAWAQITIEATQPAKKSLIEEFTGAWCGYCPRGGVTLADLTSSDPNIIGVALHDNDHMSTTEGDDVISSYASGFPSGMVDRSFQVDDYPIDDSQWGTVAAARENEIVPATVALSSITFNSTTRVISVTVTATFVGDVKGAYGLNCYVAENRVYGPINANTDNNWNQHSYYYDDPSSSFYNAGFLPSAGDHSLAYLRPSEYSHNHVLTKMMGGAFGNSTTIPTTLVTAGQTFSKTFTYTLPAANPGGAHRFNPDNIYLIGIVQEYSASSKADRYILNVTEQKLNTNPENVGPLSVQNIEKVTFGTVSIYPNPASSSANIAIDLINNENISINVYDALGQIVFSENHSNLNAGNHLVSFNTESLNSGIYNIVITTTNCTVTKKIAINK